MGRTAIKMVPPCLLAISALCSCTVCAENLLSRDDDGMKACDSSMALSGIAGAAKRCAETYVHDIGKRIYWTQIAAENGDMVSQYNMAMDLFSTGKKHDRVRAVFWLKLAANQGEGTARDLLKDLELNPDMEVPPPPPARERLSKGSL